MVSFLYSSRYRTGGLRVHAVVPGEARPRNSMGAQYSHLYRRRQYLICRSSDKMLFSCHAVVIRGRVREKSAAVVRLCGMRSPRGNVLMRLPPFLPSLYSPPDGASGWRNSSISAFISAMAASNCAMRCSSAPMLVDSGAVAVKFSISSSSAISPPNRWV